MYTNSLFILRARRWHLGIVVALLCGFGTSHALSAVQERGLVTAGSLDWGQEKAFAYATVDGKYPNIFREQGGMFAVILIADQRNGKYVDDQVGIYDITPGRCCRGWRFPIHEGESSRDLAGVSIRAKVQKRDGALWLSVGFPGASMSYEIAVRNLYMARAKKAEPKKFCNRDYLEGGQAGPVGAYIYFDPSVARYFTQAAPENFRLLAPIYVGVYTDESKNLLPKFQIGDTGCWMYNRGGWFSPDS